MTEIATYTDHRVETYQDVAVHRLSEWAQSADAAYKVAGRLVESSFVPAQFRGKPIEATAAILAGTEVGLSPMSALRAFDIIQGAAAPKAITLRAVAQANGHEIVLIESTETRCRMKGKRRGSSEWQTVVWTLDRAKALGLVSKDNWRKQPGAMLVARATSELARLIASDAILGIAYSSEELADGGTPEDVAAEPVAETGSRRISRRPLRVADETHGDEPSDAADAESTSEQVAGDPPAPDGITKAQLTKLHTSYSEIGIHDRDERLADASAFVGRDLASSSELTKDEASRLIDDIERRLGPSPEEEAALFGGDPS